MTLFLYIFSRIAQASLQMLLAVLLYLVLGVDHSLFSQDNPNQIMITEGNAQLLNSDFVKQRFINPHLIQKRAFLMCGFHHYLTELQLFLYKSRDSVFTLKVIAVKITTNQGWMVFRKSWLKELTEVLTITTAIDIDYRELG